jgi:hypothetical protein
MRPIAAILVAMAQLAASRADLSSLLARMGEHIEEYFARAQSIVCTETVVIESVSPSFLSEGGHARQLVYDLRVSWDAGDGSAAPDVRLTRELVRVDGHAPRPGDETECTDPQSIATDPLVMLLPGRQHENAFAWHGSPARSEVEIDFTSLERGPADVSFDGDCAHFALPGRSRGRLWVDARSGTVMRLDSELIGTFEFNVPAKIRRGDGPTSMVIEKSTSSIRYEPVRFTDPDETLVLPVSSNSLQVVRNGAMPRMRITQKFSHYRRFITDGRIVR